MLASSEAFSATWYVRPVAGGPYGSDNGTSYANAWDGMAAVVWGVSGVNTGDTLKVCSSESSPFTTADYDGGGLAVLSVDQSGVTVDGDCSASGGETMAYMTGNGTRDYGVYCADTTTCPNQTWRNLTVKSTDSRGFYIRNSLDTASAVNFTGDNLVAKEIIGAVNTIGFSGYGDGATVTDLSVTNTTDDSITWLGPNFTLDRWTAIYPAYLGATDLGDCVQIVTAGDNAKIKNGYCDKRNNSTKQCIILGDPVTGDNAEITDNICLMPSTGGATYTTKTIYSVIPNTLIARNFVSAGYYGIYAVAANATILSNVVLNQELRGIDLASTVASGTHLVAHNSVSGTPACITYNGGASVTTSAYNNLVANCTQGFTKGGSSTLTQSNNRCGQNVTTCNNGGGGSSLGNVGWVGGATPTTAQGFRLDSSSPARRIGLDLNLGNIQDHGNRAFHHPPSIGAWEIGSGDTITNNTRTTASTRTTRN